MSTLTLETYDREKPIMLLVGDRNPLVKPVIHEYLDDFTIARITSSESHVTSSSIYHIKPGSASLIKNLEERLDYAVVFLEEGSKKYLKYVFEKLEKDGTRTAVIIKAQDINIYSEIVRGIRKLPNFYFLILGDVYSERESFNPSTEVGTLIEKALSGKQIELTGYDLKPIFPVYEKDALLGINQIMLGKPSKQKAYFLFYNHPQTYISAIHLMQRLIPEIEISYAEESQNTENTVNNREEFEQSAYRSLGLTFGYLDRYFEGFEKSIHHFINRGPIREKELPSVVSLPTKVIGHQKRKIKLTGMMLAWAFILFLLINLSLGVAAVLFFKKSISSFKNGNYTAMRNEISISKFSIGLVDPIASTVVAILSSLGQNDPRKNYLLFRDSVNLLDIAASDLEGMVELPSGLNGQKLDSRISDAIFLYFEATKLRGETGSDALNTILTEDLSKMLALTQVTPEVLGFDREKTYLLLFQNDGELRPTGGFIGSVGILKIKNGKILSLDVQDVYEYDGKLKIHIDPPFIARRYLQKDLYLRDSNFDLDFQNAAVTAAQLLNIESGQKVDGVIAVNFEAVRRIIGEIGPIHLSSYNQKLDRDNAFGFLEKTIDDNFFPGSTQKKDVLKALYDQIMVKLEDKRSLAKVARIIPKLAQEKQILFAFNDTSIQSIFSSLNLGGQYLDRRESDGTVNDFLSVNEANIGATKANEKVERKISYSADITQPKIISKIDYIIDNSADEEYKTYIRFLTPQGSNLLSIKIDGVEQKVVPAISDPKFYEAENFTPPKGLEVYKNIEVGRQVFGFLTAVGARSKQELVLEYENGINKQENGLFSYSLLFVKQPGTRTIPLSLELDYGQKYAPSEVKGATLGNGFVKIQRQANTDIETNVKLISR